MTDQIGYAPTESSAFDGAQPGEHDAEQRADHAAAPDQERGQQLDRADDEVQRAPHRQVAEQQLVGGGSSRRWPANAMPSMMLKHADDEEQHDRERDPVPARSSGDGYALMASGSVDARVSADHLDWDDHRHPSRAGGCRGADDRRRPAGRGRAPAGRERRARAAGQPAGPLAQRRVWLLLVLGCGLAVLSLVAVWLRVTLLDTDRYVDTVAPIAAEPAVQDAVADKLETAIYSRVDFAVARPRGAAGPRRRARAGDPARRAVGDQRPDRGIHALGALPGAVGRGQPARAHARRGAARPAGARAGSRSTTTRSTSTSRPRSTGCATALPSAGWTGSRPRSRRRVDGRIELVQSEALADAQRGVRLLKAIAIMLPLLALLCLVGSVFLAQHVAARRAARRDRRRDRDARA